MRSITFLLLLLTGLGMALPGGWLLLLGGSPYYLVAGVLIVVCAILVLRRSPFAVTLYWLIFLGTLLWSLWEVGLDGWALMPRLVYLFVGGVWLLLARGSIRRAPVALLVVIGVSPP
jgi:quinoprotein glucose dehydrogenase